MNKIELILDKSIFEINQFSAAQIAVLNEMVANNISEDQVCIIAHPSVNELSYSVLYEYLSKGNSITSVEYQKYLNIDTDRINDIIVNVYLGKLHGLSDDQISLYAQKSVFNIKIARLLVEKSKDASPEQLSQLINGKFGTQSIVGKQAIQDYINGELDLDHLLCLRTLDNLTQDTYEIIKKADNRVMSVLNEAITQKILTDEPLSAQPRIIQSINIGDNYNDIVSEYFNNGRCTFDTLDTFNKLVQYRKLVNSNANHYRNFESTEENLYNYCTNFSSNSLFIRAINSNLDVYYYYYYEDKSDPLMFNDISCLIVNYFSDDYIWKRSSHIILYKEEFSSFNEYLEVFINTNGFKDYVQAKWIDKLSEKEINNIKQGISYLQSLLDLYKTKKDKETEIPYLEEHLKDATLTQIAEVIHMKENKCSNDEIHLYIEKYLSSTKCLPSMYFNNEDKNYSKYWNISAFLQINDQDIALNDMYRLKEADFSDEDIQFVIDNRIILYNSPVQKQLIEVYKDYGAVNLQFCDCENRVTRDNSYAQSIVSNYNYAKSVFKNKVKCIGFYISYDDKYRIPKNLVQYIDNFDDDNLREILRYPGYYIDMCLKLSTISTDFKTLKSIYDNMGSTTIEKFNQETENEKLTKDVVVKFCKDNDIKLPSDLFEDQVEVSIERSVEYFGSSKNFKPIKYDDETTYIDIIGNKALKGSHIITFNKEEDESYEYIFEIVHKEDNLTYSSKITTKKDVKDAITKSIALIENIEEYKEYADELQELLKSI